MTIRLIRRLEKLEIKMAPVKRYRLFWIDPETGERELVAGFDPDEPEFGAG